MTGCNGEGCYVSRGFGVSRDPLHLPFPLPTVIFLHHILYFSFLLLLLSLSFPSLSPSFLPYTCLSLSYSSLLSFVLSILFLFSFSPTLSSPSFFSCFLLPSPLVPFVPLCPPAPLSLSFSSLHFPFSFSIVISLYLPLQSLLLDSSLSFPSSLSSCYTKAATTTHIHILFRTKPVMSKVSSQYLHDQREHTNHFYHQVHARTVFAESYFCNAKQN